MPDTDKRCYIVYNTEAFVSNNDTMDPEKILVISMGLVLIPGLLIGFILFKIMFKPINQLTVKIQDLNPENIPGHWENNEIAGEIGILNQTLETAMSRIQDFIEREKQFTRDASHELRTPLTVVKGAVEILEDQQELTKNNMMEKPLNRIRRSIKNMENLIETFLWLAREEKPSGQESCVSAAVHEAVENNRYLIEKKDIDVDIDIRQDALVPVKKEILYITVVNLIRNAFQFTSKGSVSLIVENDSISVKDTGTDIDPDKLDAVTLSHIKGKDSRGFGLGLNIVSRRCGRYGWDLDIQSSLGEGTQIKIKFGKKNRFTF